MPTKRACSLGCSHLVLLLALCGAVSADTSAELTVLGQQEAQLQGMVGYWTYMGVTRAEAWLNGRAILTQGQGDQLQFKRSILAGKVTAEQAAKKKSILSKQMASQDLVVSILNPINLWHAYKIRLVLSLYMYYATTHPRLSKALQLCYANIAIRNPATSTPQADTMLTATLTRAWVDYFLGIETRRGLLLELNQAVAFDVWSQQFSVRAVFNLKFVIKSHEAKTPHDAAEVEELKDSLAMAKILASRAEHAYAVRWVPVLRSAFVKSTWALMKIQLDRWCIQLQLGMGQLQGTGQLAMKVAQSENELVHVKQLQINMDLLKVHTRMSAVHNYLGVIFLKRFDGLTDFISKVAATSAGASVLPASLEVLRPLHPRRIDAAAELEMLADSSSMIELAADQFPPQPTTLDGLVGADLERKSAEPEEEATAATVETSTARTDIAPAVAAAPAAHTELPSAAHTEPLPSAAHTERTIAVLEVVMRFERRFRQSFHASNLAEAAASALSVRHSNMLARHLQTLRLQAKANVAFMAFAKLRLRTSPSITWPPSTAEGLSAAPIQTPIQTVPGSHTTASDNLAVTSPTAKAPKFVQLLGDALLHDVDAAAPDRQPVAGQGAADVGRAWQPQQVTDPLIASLERLIQFDQPVHNPPSANVATDPREPALGYSALLQQAEQWGSRAPSLAQWAADSVPAPFPVANDGAAAYGVGLPTGAVQFDLTSSQTSQTAPQQTDQQTAAKPTVEWPMIPSSVQTWPTSFFPEAFPPNASGFPFPEQMNPSMMDPAKAKAAYENSAAMMAASIKAGLNVAKKVAFEGAKTKGVGWLLAVATQTITYLHLTAFASVYDSPKFYLGLAPVLHASLNDFSSTIAAPYCALSTQMKQSYLYKFEEYTDLGGPGRVRSAATEWPLGGVKTAEDGAAFMSRAVDKYTLFNPWVEGYELINPVPVSLRLFVHATDPWLLNKPLQTLEVDVAAFARYAPSFMSRSQLGALTPVLRSIVEASHKIQCHKPQQPGAPNPTYAQQHPFAPPHVFGPIPGVPPVVSDDVMGDVATPVTYQHNTMPWHPLVSRQIENTVEGVERAHKALTASYEAIQASVLAHPAPAHKTDHTTNHKTSLQPQGGSSL